MTLEEMEREFAQIRAGYPQRSKEDDNKIVVCPCGARVKASEYAAHLASTRTVSASAGLAPGDSNA